MSHNLAMKALDLQIDLGKWVQTGGGYAYCNAIYDFQKQGQPTIISGTIKGVAYKLDRPGSMLVLRNLIAAETFAVSDEIGDVLEFGAQSIPAFTLHESDLPAESGFVVFETPRVIADGRGKPLVVKAISWDTVRMNRELYDSTLGVVNDAELERFKSEHEEVRSVSGLLLVAYTDPTDPRDHMHEQWVEDLELFYRAEHAVPPLLPISGGLWEFDRPPLEEYTHDQMIRTLATFLRFVQEPWIDPRAIVPSRQARKRALRANLEPKVRVVQLRRKASDDRRRSDDPQPGNYSHRWFVRGHWRNQWYPSEQRHAPRFIHGYVKGPEDKPLVVNDTVFEVSR